MSEPYDHIWLQFYGEDKSLGKAEEITWCEDEQHDCDVKYIRADLHEAQPRTARSDALEEAAMVCDACEVGQDVPNIVRHVAMKIRALKEST